MIQCSRRHPPRVAIALSLRSGPPPISRQTSVFVFTVFRGESSRSTYNYGGDTCPFAPRVLPAWHDSISGGEGGFQYSGTDAFQVTPIFISTSNPTWTFTLGNALWHPAGITVEFARQRAFSGGTAGHGLDTNWLSLLGCQRWCVLQCTKTPALQWCYCGREITCHSSAFSCIELFISVCCCLAWADLVVLCLRPKHTSFPTSHWSTFWRNIGFRRGFVALSLSAPFPFLVCLTHIGL